MLNLEKIIKLDFLWRFYNIVRVVQPIMTSLDFIKKTLSISKGLKNVHFIIDPKDNEYLDSTPHKLLESLILIDRTFISLPINTVKNYKFPRYSSFDENIIIFVLILVTIN
jgi:hypothetical protein